MKYFYLTIAAFFVFTGSNYAQKKKVAVVTFYANKMVEFNDLGIGNEMLLKEVLELRDNPNFNLTPLLDKFHTNFFEQYATVLPFDLLPESEVLANEAYRNFTPKYDLTKFEARDYLMYGDYKYIYEGFMGQANEKAMASMFADKADGVMFVYITFAFEKGFGIGGTATVKMRATTRMALYNKKGEKVFAFVENERSKKTGMMVGGIPVISPEKILPMCDSALTELMGDLKKRLTKISNTAAKKL